MTRVGLIEKMLPKRPVDSRTGRTLDYHSQIYCQTSELISICRKVFGHMKEEVAKRDIENSKLPGRKVFDYMKEEIADRDAENLKLTKALYEMTRKHRRLKESNLLLRESIRQVA